MEKEVSEVIELYCPLKSKARSFPYDSLLGGFEMTKRVIPLNTGSSAELFIEPIWSCIGDTDVLMYGDDELAFNEEVAVLPEDISRFNEVIRCHSIKPYPDYPGYVKLQRFGQMKYNWESKKYEFQAETFSIVHRFHDMKSQFELFEEVGLKHGLLNNHSAFITYDSGGPALKSKLNHTMDNKPNPTLTDHVFCIRCMQWPYAAKDWPFRQRKQNWPREVKEQVVSAGCHFVRKTHPLCEEDIFQWRFSFSVAEVILLNSMTKTQQIIFHMLRYFAKRTLIPKDSLDKGVLCTYHIKTLMLWTCEEETSEWWESACLIVICRKLLKKLAQWLKKKLCPNYFIPKVNLFCPERSEKVSKTIEILNDFGDERSRLGQWFIDHYLIDISCTKIPEESSPINSSAYMEFSAGMVTKFKNYASLFCMLNERYLFGCGLGTAFWNYIINKGTAIQTGVMYEVMINSQELETKTRCSVFCPSFSRKVMFHPYYENYLSALMQLYSKYLLASGQVNLNSDALADLLFIPLKQSNVLARHYYPHTFDKKLNKGLVYFLRAEQVMETLNIQLFKPEFEILSHLSFELLKKSLIFLDEKSHSVRFASLAYAAALCFANHRRDAAADFCFHLFRNRLTAHDSKLQATEIQNLDARCLLFIYEVQSAILHEEQELLDLRVTPIVFAQFLMALCDFKTSAGKLKSITNAVIPVFHVDEILSTIAKCKCVEIESECIYLRSVFDESDVITEQFTLLGKNEMMRCLIDSSLANMESFYGSVHENLGIESNTVICYRASYLYKCHKYDQVLILCDQILHEDDNSDEVKNFTFLNILTLSPFIEYFDDEIQSLAGLKILVDYYMKLLKPPEENKKKCTDYWDHLFYLKEHCSVDSVLPGPNRVLREIFFARYLKLRCLIDLNCSTSEIISAFRVLESQLPFEYVILLFLEKKYSSYYLIMQITK